MMMILKTLRHLLQISTLGLVLMLVPNTSNAADQSIGTMILEDCPDELVKYCSQVKIGRGRTIACLYAHSDKLNYQCSLTLEIGAERLHMMLSAVNYVVNQCQADLDKHCGDVEIGSGQMYLCMSKNKDSLEQQCKSAFLQAEEDLK